MQRLVELLRASAKRYVAELLARRKQYSSSATAAAAAAAEDLDIKLVSAWANVNRAGQGNAPHTHSTHTISGVYYVHVSPAAAAGEGDGEGHVAVHHGTDLSLAADPRPCSGVVVAAAGRGSSRERQQQEPSIGELLFGDDSHASLPAREGNVIMFPGTLEHWVDRLPASTSTPPPALPSLRVSVAFDVQVQRRRGKGKENDDKPWCSAGGPGEEECQEWVPTLHWCKKVRRRGAPTTAAAAGAAGETREWHADGATANTIKRQPQQQAEKLLQLLDDTLGDPAGLIGERTATTTK